MVIQLTQEECLEYFYNSLCSAGGTGYMGAYGLGLEFNESEYSNAKSKPYSN